MRGRFQGGQRGSLAGFIIVGVLLAIVLIGGLYGLNRYSAQKASETAAQNQKKTTTDIPNDNQSTEKKDDSKKSPASSPTPAPTKTDTGSKTPTATAPSNPVAQSPALPHTGPSDSPVSLIMVTMLTFIAAHMVQSRRVRI